MSKHDEARRAFLIGAAVGAGAVAGAGLVPEALAQTHEQHQATNAPATTAQSHAQGSGHGAFLNDDDAATIAAFAERLMPGAPGKPGAREAGVLNYIDLALSGAYEDLQDFYRRGLASLDAYCRKTYNAAIREARCCAAGRGDHGARARQGHRVHLAQRARRSSTPAHAHDGRHVRRPDLRRQQGLRRLAPGRLPRRASGVHACGYAEQRGIRRRRFDRLASASPDAEDMSHGHRKNGCRDRRCRRSRRNSRGRARQGRHESHWSGARPASCDQGLRPQDELRYFQRQDLRPHPKRQPITWRPNANGRANPIPTQSYGNQAGGGTVHYGAVSWRFHEDDFRVRSQTIERYGVSAIPADSSVTDWPLSYAELEPYYDRAEYELRRLG